jgi:hypothetical protein
MEEWTPSLVGHYLSVSPTSFSFTSYGEIQRGNITSISPWKFDQIPSWLDLTPSSGSSDAEFSITSEANDSTSNRTAIFYLSDATTDDEAFTKAITASQKGATPYINFVNTASREVSYASQTIELEVSTNIKEPTVSFSQDWGTVTYNSEKKVILLSLQQNDTDASRSGYVSVSVSGTTNKVSVTQHASGITIGEGKTLSFDADGGTQTVNISSDLAWTAKTSCAWLEFSPESGNAGDTKISIKALPSYEATNRSGTIYFYIGETSRTYVSVSQTGRYIKLSQETASLTSDENAEATVSLDANVAWKVSSFPDWLTISPSQGSIGNSTIKLTATKNNSLNSRSGTIIFSDTSSYGVESKLVVTQEGLTYNIQDAVEFTWRESTKQLDVPYPYNWSAAISDSWFSLSEYSGQGSKTIDVNVEQNNDATPRTGSIIFTYEGQTSKVTIVQQGQYIQLDNTAGEFDAIGGSVSLSLASSVETSWNVNYDNSDEHWVAVTETEPSKYLLNVAYNPSAYERSCTFVVTPTETASVYQQGVQFQIKQLGRKLSADVSRIDISKAGGETAEYVITSEGSYSIAKDSQDYWYSLVHNASSKSFHLVVATNTSDSDRTGKVTISLTDLPNGESKNIEIEIYQENFHEDINVSIINDYGDDEDWNL